MIMFLNLKGGVAKTTNSVAIAEVLASQKKKVLVIDADHQSLAGELLLGENTLEHIESRRKTLHDLMAFMLSDDFTIESFPSYITKKASLVGSIQESIDCIACSHRIDEFATNMAKAKRGFKTNEEFLTKLNRLRRTFTKWCNEHYDYTIIDCPPSFAFQVLFLLGCAQYYIIPTIPDRLSIRGSLYLMERMRMRGYTRIECLGTLWSMVRVQVKKHLEMMKSVQNKKSEMAIMPKPFKTYIPNMAAIANAMDSTQSYTLIQEKYYNKTLSIYQTLCKEIENRIST